MMQFSETFLHCYTIETPIQDLWNIFKNAVLRLSRSCFIYLSVRNPWINNHVKQLINKNSALYLTHPFIKVNYLLTGRLLQWYLCLRKAVELIVLYNYRPTSLTCVCCEVFEHIVSSAISNHANFHNIICTEQHEFRKH